MFLLDQMRNVPSSRYGAQLGSVDERPLSGRAGVGKGSEYSIPTSLTVHHGRFRTFRDFCQGRKMNTSPRDALGAGLMRTSVADHPRRMDKYSPKLGLRP